MITNRYFIEAVFRRLKTGARPLVLGFSGDPNSPHDWSGMAWRESGNTVENPQLNNFVAVSSFTRGPRGYRVARSEFSAMHFVMLDDVESPGSLPMPPTYVIETSPANYQCGYVLHTPVDDVALAARILGDLSRAVKNFGGNNVTRWARLPSGTNTKKKYGAAGFTHRCIDFNDRRYGWKDITDAFGVNTAPVLPYTGPRIVYDRRRCDIIIPALRAAGTYRAPLSGGRHAIMCPWRDNHTGRIQGRTDSIYFEPSEENFGRGGYRCLHSHCADMGIDDLLGVCDYIVYDARERGYGFDVNGDSVPLGEMHE